MLRAKDFIDNATRQGFNFYTGVPCSYLTPLINGVISQADLQYVGAASEGEAVGIAAGAWLAGRRCVVMCQNSGLGNAINPLTSLNAPFGIPTLLIVTWRGQPGHPDEPQHQLMGRITGEMLSLIEVDHAPFPDSPEYLAEALADARSRMDGTRRPFAFVMAEGTVESEPLRVKPRALWKCGATDDRCRGGEPPSRAQILERFLELVDPACAVIATTGKTGRELFMLADRPQQLYLVGSMGCASGVGLGVALNSERRVVVLDGDGAALMKLGTFATIGACAPQNLVHILLDNGVHDSTGGQPTVSASVRFDNVAQACGYARAASCDDLNAFEELFLAYCALPGPSLIHVRILPGSLARLIRPTVTPAEVALRFKAFLAQRR
ncbi:MAG: phosphonopyruvate decarboxylase [Alphaproteobacteria bacterium]|nr:phosphonopyruvate decarboxylase [Alphaproteobacteria bacterium]